MTTRHNLDLALQSASDGALVLTSNTRAARNLKREFADRQRAAGLEVWKSPDILPWSSWLRRLWQEQIYRKPGPFTAVLDEAQEQIVWERLISGEGGSLDAVSLAEQCVRAWRLLHSFRMPRERALFRSKKDTAEFFKWAGLYSGQCTKNGWLDEARLSDAVRETAIAECSGRKLVLWGFDRFTPQEHELLKALQAAGIAFESLRADGETASAQRYELDDTHAELRAAAEWSRGLLERSPKTSVGIVVPNLDEIRGMVERVLLEVLHPDALTIAGTDGRRAFDLSLGVPRAETPVVGAAMMLLEIAAGPISLEKASRLLRSAFVGNQRELGARCLLDTEIRANGFTEISLESLDDWVNKKTEAPQFATSLRRLKVAVAKLPRRQTASRWSREIMQLLATAGWPGSRTETSSEHQARQAFADLLGKFAKFDLVLEAIEFPVMFRRLRALADETLFQPENLGAPIQVVGMLEAAGSRFDHLWVVGMHADAWPPPPNPSPFLPLELQRRLSMTGASSQERLAYAQQVTERLLTSAPDVVFSSPLRDGDQELSVSPLIAGFPVSERISRSQSNAAEVVFGVRALQDVLDETGPKVMQPISSGGTGIFQLQAACPFRAFAELRLGAEKLEMPTPGMDPRERGGLLHKSLELLWLELRSHSVLQSKSKAELKELVRRSVDYAVDQSKAAAYVGWELEVADIERERLTGLILDLIDLEKQRKPFRVVERELRKEVQIGGVSAKVKVDRIDELEDGRQVLLDYKSGDTSTSSWKGGRPDEPQLPIYATQQRQELAGVSFVRMKRGDVCFDGYAREDGLLPSIPAFEAIKGRHRPEEATFDELLANWQMTLESLGRGYRLGHAIVDPKNGIKTCKYCHLKMVCRIDEAPLGPQGEEDDE